MFSKLREILLTQYIGSILIALLLVQAAIEVVARVARTGFWVFNHQHAVSVLGGSSTTPYPWDKLIFSAVTTALYLLIAYALARWLYPTTSPTAQTDLVEASTDPDQSQPS